MVSPPRCLGGRIYPARRTVLSSQSYPHRLKRRCVGLSGRNRIYGGSMQKRLSLLLGFLLSLHSISLIRASDHFLTIGGGESPTNNQVSLEKNILYLQRFLSESGLGSMANDIYFANGKETGRDIQFVDPTTPPPKVNQLLAQIFDKEDDLD